MVEVITLATRRRILTEDELNLIGGADVRGLPGSDVASSILTPSEVENGKKLELVEIGTNLIVKGEMDAAKKKQFCQGLSICSLARTDGRDAKAEKVRRGVVENYVVVVRAAAIHWLLLLCDGVTRQSVE